MKLARLLALVPVVPALVATAACNVDLPRVVTASGNPEARDFDLSGFTQIEAGAAFQVDVERADTFAVRVTSDDNLWDVLDIRRSGDTLRLMTKSGVSVLRSTLKAEVKMPALNAMELSGASRGKIEGFNADTSVAFTLSGASTLDMVNTRSGRTTFEVSGASRVSGTTTMTDGRFDVSGAGRVELKGSGRTVNIDASGASQVDLDEFKLESVGVTASGASQARVDAAEITRANLSGASRLFYAGSPKIGNVETSGGSSITRK